ncbi:MAG: hypothetical protein LBP32_02170 [Spirochaetaceae bacterium]|jgi:hypothetical protein|nr:hypothetical protein [Spirochaetaceae bacterium]
MTKKRFPIFPGFRRLGRLVFLASGLLIPRFMDGQEPKPVIALVPFETRGLSPGEGRIIESLIRSYITDLGDRFFLLDTAGEGGPPPDYIISGSVSLEEDGRVLMLSIREGGTGKTVYAASTYKSAGELALRAKSLVETAFLSRAEDYSQEERAEPMTEAAVAGTWRGDRGIELVHLRRDGGGVAIFSSGARMRLRYVIEDNTLKVIQNSPNTERFYHPVPYGVARRLVEEADPMRWELLLFNNGALLRGIKVTTGARYEGDRVLELLPHTAESAEWVKAGR